MSDFQTYQSYPSAEAAQPLLDLLQERNIPFETATDNGQPAFDPTFAFNPAFTRFEVKIPGGDFEWVRRLEEEAHSQLLATISPDHYLFGFSDPELFDILVKPDEWSNLDVALAGQLLRQRGRDVSADTVRLMRQHRVAELAKPEPDMKGRIRWGYGLALLGGVMAIFIGWDLYYHKKTLPDGRQITAYSSHDRVHGLRIMVLGIVCLLGWTVVRVIQD
jgi:hypothetical protein